MLPLAADAAGFTLNSLSQALLVGSITLIVCIVAIRFSVRTGLPSLLIYLGVGLAIGESGLGIDYSDAQLTQVLGYAALILILAEGGLTTRWSSIRRALAPAALLATLGVAVSVAIVAAAGHYVLGWSWTTALLIGAIVSSTDAAAVFSVLRSVPLPARLTGMLEAEAGFNDAPVVILVTALATSAAHPGQGHSPTELVGLAGMELLGGALIGLAIGAGGGWLMRRNAAGSSGLFSIGILALTVLAYAAGATVHLSGFIATYLCALVLGNLDLPHRVPVHAFATALGSLAQIALFVLLGLLASPGGFATQLLPALLVGVVLTFVARPASVAASVAWFGFSWREQAFLSWAGLRGAVPVVLATVPVTARAPDVNWIFDLVFVLVVVFTLVQAPSLPWVARRLGVTQQHLAQEMTVESTPISEVKGSLLHVVVGEESQLHGVAIFELRLPVGADVALIVRDGHTRVPTPRTRIQRGDHLMLVTTDAQRRRAERLIQAVSEHGRLAGWASARDGDVAKSPGRPGWRRGRG